MPKTTINYQDTVIYKIVCKDLSVADCYVGHTTSFAKRKARHKYRCHNQADGANFKIYKVIRDNGGWDNWSMVEIEKYPCNDSNEACARERYWYEQLYSTMNTNKPFNAQNRVYRKQKFQSEYRADPESHKLDWMIGCINLSQQRDNDSSDEWR